jgi:tRNA dimethylallyltransferase
MREFPEIRSLNIGLDVSRELRRERITRRLHERLEQGMVDEVRGILASGVAPEDLIYYGLEYKYLTMYVIGRLTYDEMVSQLEIAIHQFAKRQMTYFRGMERRGVLIHWIDTTLSTEEKVEQICELLNR